MRNDKTRVFLDVCSEKESKHKYVSVMKVSAEKLARRFFTSHQRRRVMDGVRRIVSVVFF